MSTVHVPTTGCYLGTTVKGSSLSHLTQLDGYISPKKFAVVRAFAHVDSFTGGKMPAFVQSCGNEGKLVVLSVNGDLQSGSGGSWNAMAQGHLDSYLAQWSAALKSYGHPLLLTYCHEPYWNASATPGLWSGGIPPKYGQASTTMKDSIAGEWLGGFNHIISYLQSNGVTNVSYFPDFQSEYHDNYARWMPQHFDWLMNDSFPTSSTQTFAQSNANFYTWAHQNHPTTPLGVGACSNLAGTDAEKAAWYQSVPAGLAAQPQMKLWDQWDGDPWYPQSTFPQAFPAFQHMAQNAVFTTT